MSVGEGEREWRGVEGAEVEMATKDREPRVIREQAAGTLSVDSAQISWSSDEPCEFGYSGSRR